MVWQSVNYRKQESATLPSGRQTILLCPEIVLMFRALSVWTRTDGIPNMGGGAKQWNKIVMKEVVAEFPREMQKRSIPNSCLLVLSHVTEKYMEDEMYVLSIQGAPMKY